MSLKSFLFTPLYCATSRHGLAPAALFDSPAAPSFSLSSGKAGIRLGFHMCARRLDSELFSLAKETNLQSERRELIRTDLTSSRIIVTHSRVSLAVRGQTLQKIRGKREGSREWNGMKRVPDVVSEKRATKMELDVCPGSPISCPRI